jgi:hypothetical protein
MLKNLFSYLIYGQIWLNLLTNDLPLSLQKRTQPVEEDNEKQILRQEEG